MLELAFIILNGADQSQAAVMKGISRILSANARSVLILPMHDLGSMRPLIDEQSIRVHG